MRHMKPGQETINSLQPVIPQRTMIDGKPFLSFRDILYNLVLNNLKSLDYDTIDKKVQKATTRVLSPKHRRRILKQMKKSMPRT